MNPKHVLISGAAGFIGSALAAHLKQHGYTLHGLDMAGPRELETWEHFDICDCSSFDFEKAFKTNDYEAFVHLAASSSVPASMEDPIADFNSILPHTAKAVYAMGKFSRKTKFVLFSSAAVYGNPSGLPISAASPVAPISPYGIHKACAELLVREYAGLYNFKCAIVRPFSVYGPGLKRQVVYDICKKVLEAAESKARTICLHGTGNETRDFIHVHDLCAATRLVMERDQNEPAVIYNIANGVETKISELANLVCRHLALDIGIAFDGAIRPGDPLNWRADIRELLRCGFHPSLDLAVGVGTVLQGIKSVDSARD